MQSKKNIVKCGVSDCSYYNDSYCCAGEIKIDGKTATTPETTRCSTFSNSGNMVNSVEYGSKGGEAYITCDATECRHNSDCKCMLNDIDVSCTCTSCDCNSNDQTFCASFKL